MTTPTKPRNLTAARARGVVAGRGIFTGRSIDQCSAAIPSGVYASLDAALERDLEHRGLVVVQRADGGRAVVQLAEPA